MARIRLVLIEDHDLTRMGLRTALQRDETMDYLGDATTATEGLALIEQHRPDIAIVDIGLPDFDGIELTRRLRHGAIPTKVLILTLQDQDEAVMAAFAAGADSYCMKDIRLDLLLEAIKATHGGQSWIDPTIARLVLSHAQGRGSNSEAMADRETDSSGLTQRELEVLQLIVDGCSNADIAEKLFITVGTVKTHVRNILNKLCADDRTQAAVRALRSGLVG